ncbi:MAG TPA: two-component regulator propeller domain-containing protein [Terracidiphilus sp.]|nr:two-component regulator propeller domain-containing protein [Terracidiphilus sp.]
MLCVLAAAGTASTRALEPTTLLGSYGRQWWVMENGMPQNTVHALAQTRDGFLWIGTEVGLVRFDGHSFLVLDEHTEPKLPSGDIRCLLTTDDGALWIGTSDGLARLKNGTVRVYTEKDGLPSDVIRNLGLSAHGRIWVNTASGSIEIDHEIVDSKSLYAGNRPPGEESDLAVHSPDGGWASATATMLVIGHGGRKDAQLSIGRELPGTKIQELYADREGSLWIGTNAGLVRWANGKLEKLPVTDPLANASVLTILEDHEGDLWVGTETDGLHILRDERFKTFGAREGLSSDNTTAVVEDKAGTLWVGTNGDGLNALKHDPNGKLSVRVLHVRDGLMSNVILALAAAPNGDVWVGTPDGLNRIHEGRVTGFTSADGLPDDFVRSLLADADGSLWIGTRRGLTHWINAGTGHAMVTVTQAGGLGSDLVGAMEHDTNGDLWVATLAGLSRLKSGKTEQNAITNYTTANGLPSNVVTALLPRAAGAMLIGTQDHGWSLWNGAKFVAVNDSRLQQTSVYAILADAENHFWFATDNGIARCDETGTATCGRWLKFGPADGLRSRETATNSHPSAWRSHDGLLWFATPKGLVEIDPAHFPVNDVVPPVALESFTVDDVPRPVNVPSEIQAGHVHFQFDYAGLSFVAPQKVRYRYMLEGFDKDWTEADTRRTAYYTNIPPGKYTFRVQAANNDGLWNTEGARLQFELKPHFYQTLWFYVLLSLCMAGLVVLYLKRRLLRAEREFSAVLGERNRIAREVHDTLAQGYVGISVQLEVLAELLRHNKVDAAAKHLDTTRSYVREGLADARQSIWALRSQDSGEKTLPVELRRVTEHAEGHGLETKFSLFGAYRALGPETEREILRIAQEALHNVKKHAQAAHVFVQLEYGPEEIALEVRDDGRGFDRDKGEGTRPGHYGMTGMRERAETIGGRLEVTSEPGAGTTVRLTVHAPKTAKE